MTDTFKEQLKAVISEYELACSQSKHGDALETLSPTQITDLQMRCITAIERAAGRNSTCYEEVMKISREKTSPYYQVALQIGVAKALLSDIENGYLQSFEEIIHKNLFADYLEMAAHLVETGCKDLAAVAAGNTLEVHLRQLCEKHGVAAESDNNKMKKAAMLNQDLRKADAYDTFYQKSIDAWLDIRNNAAHGKYDKYDKPQVKDLIAGIRDFINRHPA